MGINFNKITEAVKKALENTNKVSEENEGKSYNKPSETYDANIFTGTKEDWEKQDNELFNSLDEQGYNRGDLHTLFDTNQDGVISEEESLYIAGLDGIEEVSNEDIEIYLEELATLDISSLGDTEEEIIASAERKIPLLDFNDPNVEEKLFDFLGVEIVDGKISLTVNEEVFTENIYNLFEEYPEALDYFLENTSIREDDLGYFYGLSREELATLNIPTSENSEKVNNALKELVKNNILAEALSNAPESDFYKIATNAIALATNGEKDISSFTDKDYYQYFGVEKREFFKLYSEEKDFQMTLSAFNLYALNNGIPLDDSLVYRQSNPSFKEENIKMLFQEPEYKKELLVTFTDQELEKSIINSNFVEENGTYTSTISYDEDGNIISEIRFTNTYGEEVIIFSTFDKTTNKMINQNETTTFPNGRYIVSTEFKEDGSFKTVSTMYSVDENGEESIDWSIENNSEYLILTELTQYGENLDVDARNQNDFISSLSTASTCEEAYKRIEIYCGGDTVTADKMYTALYGKTPKTESNIYHQNASGLVDRMFDVQNGKQILSSDFLKSFVSEEKNENGTSTVTTYNIINGDFCITEDTISTVQTTDEMPLTSVRTSSTRDSSGNIIDEKTVMYNYAYTTVDGQPVIDDEKTVVTIIRDGQEDITENLSDYYKRFAIESFYGINTNMSTEDVNIYYYQVFQNDMALSNICADYIAERDSEGIFDTGYNAVKRLLGLGTLPEDVQDEIIQRALMTTALKNFYDGNIEEATKYCEDEFFRRVYNTNSFSEIYNQALDFYGNEEYAMQFIEELFKNENIQKYSLPTFYQDENFNYADYSSLDVEETPPGSGNYVLLYNIEIDNGRYITTVEITDMAIGSINKNEFDNTVKDAYKNVIDEETGKTVTIPANADAIYSFYTKGGKVDIDNISEYETACENWNSYNQQIKQTETVEEILTTLPAEDAINFFIPEEGTIEEGIALFNDYYNGILGDDTAFNAYATYNEETGEIEVQIIYSGMDYTLNLKYNNETKLVEIPDEVINDYDFSTADGAFMGLNYHIKDNNLYTVSEFKEYRQNDASGVNESATQYAEHVLENEELRNEYAKKIGCKKEDLTIEDVIKYIHSDEHCVEESKKFMQYVKDETYSALYGENLAREVLEKYSSDMDSYASTLSKIATYTCIGLSVASAVVCPAAAPVFMKAALYTGYIDNAIDLGNMMTNNQKDDYVNWALNLAKEYIIKKGFKVIGQWAGAGANSATSFLSSNWSYMANNAFGQKVFNWLAESVIETVISIPYLAVINGGKIDLSDEFVQNMIFDGIPYLQAGAFEMNGLKSGEIYDETGVKYRVGENNERIYYDDQNRPYKVVNGNKTTEYDENGRPIKIVDGDTTTRYTYNDKFNTVESTSKDANGNTYVKRFDSKGQLIEGTLCDANGKIISSTECTYKDGKLTERITTNEVDKSVLTTKYDQNGRPTSETIKNEEDGTEIQVNYEYQNGKLSSITETNKSTGETIRTEFDETGMPERTTVIQYEYKDGYGISELADSDGTILVSYQTETGKTFEVNLENSLKLQDAPKETIEHLADLQSRGWDVDTLMSAVDDFKTIKFGNDNTLYVGDKAYALPENITPSMVSKCIAQANGDIAKGFEIANDYKSMLYSMDIAKQDPSTETCAMSASLSAMVSDSGWGQALLNNITYNPESGKYTIKIGEKTLEFNYTAGDNIVETIYREYTNGYSNKTAASDFMQAIFPDSSKLLLSSTPENLATVKDVINNGTGIVTFNIGKNVTATDTNGVEIQLSGEHAYVVSKVNDDGSVVLKDTQDNEITVSKEEFERISTEGDGQFAGRVAGLNSDITDGITTERAVGTGNILKENNQNKLIEKGITPKFATEISNELNIEIKEIRGGPSGGQIILNDGTMLTYGIRKQANDDVILSFNNKKFTYNSENVLQSVYYERGTIKITEHYVDGIYNGKTEFCPTKSYYEYTTFDNNGNKIKFERKTKQDQLIYDETYEILPNGQRTTYTNYESGVKIETEKYSDGTSKQKIEVNITPEMQKGITHHVGANNSVNGGFLYGGHYLSGYEKLFDMDTIELTLYTKNKNGRGVIKAGTTTATIQKSADGNEITIKYTDENGNAITLKIERGLQNADGTYTYKQTKIDANNNIIETRPKTVVNQEQYENMYRELQDMPPERFYSVDNIKDPSMKEIYFYTNTENGRIYWRYITNGTTLYPINETEIPKDVLNYFKNN